MALTKIWPFGMVFFRGYICIYIYTYGIYIISATKNISQQKWFCESSPRPPKIGCVSTSGAPEFMNFLHNSSHFHGKSWGGGHFPINSYHSWLSRWKRTNSFWVWKEYVVDCCTTPSRNGPPGNSLSPQGRSFFIALRAPNLEVQQGKRWLLPGKLT